MTKRLCTPHEPEVFVRNVLAEIMGLNASQIKDNDTIRDDLKADSLDAVEIVMALEDEFEFCLPDEAWENCLTVADLIKTVKGRPA